MSFVGAPKGLGVDVTVVDTTKAHELGTVVHDAVGGVYQYILAGGEITANAPVKVATGWSATVSGNAGVVYGVAETAIGSGSYGWIKIKGVVAVDAATDVDAGDKVARICDSSGQVKEAVAVAEGGSTSHAAGDHDVIGVGLVNEAANVATILLF